MITDFSSKQYQFIQSYIEIGADGLLYSQDGFIGVALGSYYGEIGDRFILTFEDQRKIGVIKIEAKADEHTINGCSQFIDGSMVELIIDINKTQDTYAQAMLMGDFNYSALFNGRIVDVEYLF